MGEINVLDFHPVADGVTDDQPAFAAAQAAVEKYGGSLYVPAGTYALGRRAQYSALWFKSDKPMRIRGDGMGATVLKMAPGSYIGDFYLLRNESDSLQLESLTLDGNRANIPVFDEQTHLVQVHDVRRFVCRDVEFRECHGDGIKAAGTGGAGANVLVDDMLIDACTFRHNGRSGITIQRAVRNARIRGCYFVDTSDQDIDFEPSGTTAPSRIIIEGNTIDHTTAPASITLSGISGADRSNDVLLVDNIINGGAVGGIDMRNIIVRGNRIAAPDGQRCLDFSRGVDNLLVEGNILSNVGAEGITVQGANGRSPVGVTIRGNSIRTSRSHGIYLASCASVLVANNRLLDVDGLGGRGIQARATMAPVTAPDGTVTRFPVRDTRIDGNLIEGYGIAISVNASQNEGCADCSVSNNSFSNRQVPGKVGIEFTIGTAGHGLTRMVVVGNNPGEGISKALTGLSASTAAQSISASAP